MWVEENLFFFAKRRFPSMIKPMWEGNDPARRILHVNFYKHESDYIIIILVTYNINFTSHS